MVEHDIDPTIRGRFGDIEYWEDPSLAACPEKSDSSQYDVMCLERMNAHMRTSLAADLMDRILVFGTDNAAAVMHTFAESIPPELMRDRVIIGLVSGQHASPNRPDGRNFKFYSNDQEPVEVLEDAMDLLSTMRQQLVNRLLLCCRRRAYAPRGLRKPNVVLDPIDCRFPVLGTKKKDTDWRMANIANRRELYARGKEHDYILAKGVETIDLSVTSSYANVKAMIQGMNYYGDPAGVVLTAPGDASLRDSPDELKELSKGVQLGAKNGVPVALGHGPMVSERSNKTSTPGNDRKVYAGNLLELRSKLDAMARGTSSLIDGTSLTHTEITLLISAATARARLQKNLQGEAICEYASEYIADYRQFLRSR